MMNIAEHHKTLSTQPCAINIICTANWLLHKIDNVLEPTGLSLQQYTVLAILANQPENKVTVNSIRKKMLDRQPNISRLLNKLSEKGLIIKSRCTNDQRVVYVSLTPSGEHTQHTAAMLLEKISFHLEDEKSQLLDNLLKELRMSNS